MAHTPAADDEILVYGCTVRAAVVPVSSTGCPTPTNWSRARGGSAPVSWTTPFLIGETIPGGTTTALGTFTALGGRPSVSTSLPKNPTALKREVVEAGLVASGIEPGSVTGDPEAAVRTMGDPVLPVVAGLTPGALESGTEMTLAGRTQLLAAAALVRHAGTDAPLTVATTSFVHDDESAAVTEFAGDLDVEIRVTDPGFDGSEHPAMAAFASGEAKEGVGMGGLLAAASTAGVADEELHERIATVYDRVQEAPEGEPT